MKRGETGFQRIAPLPEDEDRPPLTSAELIRLAHILAGRMNFSCPRCNNTVSGKLQSGEIRLGTSVRMTENDVGRPRLVFRCPFCISTIGIIQGDIWHDDAGLDDVESTRWSHLELDERVADEPEIPPKETP